MTKDSNYFYLRLCKNVKSDNIIFREDINRLTDLNRHLQDELNEQRNINIELANDKERLTQD